MRAGRLFRNRIDKISASDIVRCQLNGRSAPSGHASSVRALKLATFLVGQRDNNAITNATNEFKRVLILASDFVHVMSQSGNYVDRVVLSSPVHRHTLIVVLFSEHALDRLLVDFTYTHFQTGRFLEPVKAIQVRPFEPKTFVIGQSDGDGVFMGGHEFERAVVIIMDSFVGEGFICTAHGDVVAVLVPADIYFVTRHAIEVRERAFNGLAVDICPVHERYFQFESNRRSQERHSSKE